MMVVIIIFTDTFNVNGGVNVKKSSTINRIQNINEYYNDDDDNDGMRIILNFDGDGTYTTLMVINHDGHDDW